MHFKSTPLPGVDLNASRFFFFFFLFLRGEHKGSLPHWVNAAPCDKGFYGGGSNAELREAGKQQEKKKKRKLKNGISVLRHVSGA